MVRTYVLLLFVLLGFCPHQAFGGQRAKKIEPPVTPLLPAEQAWQTDLPYPPSADAVMDEQRAYIPLEGEHFQALDRETGKTAWTVDIESPVPPLVHDGVVYLAASDELHALEAATGEHRWRVPLSRSAMAPMAVSGATVIVPITPDELWAFRISDGERLWRRSLGGRTGRFAMAVDATGISVALTDRLVRLSLDGAVLWDRTLPGELTSTAGARDRVFAGSTSNEIFAFEPGRGRLEWRFKLGGDVVGITATDDVVYVVSLDNLVRALKRSNGNQIWRRVLATRPIAPPQIAEGVVTVFGAESAATFNSRTGLPIGTYVSPNLLQGPLRIDPTPAPFAVSILAVTRDGRATGLQPVGMLFREQAVMPLTALPGRPLQKEAAPLP